MNDRVLLPSIGQLNFVILVKHELSFDSRSVLVLLLAVLLFLSLL